MNSQQYKCSGCDKTRTAQRFSSNTIKKYEETVRKSRRTGKKSDIRLPRCMDCSGQQRHELECAQCGVVKGLDSFSKQMRRNPDNAECINCVQEREDREPDHRVETEEQAIIERLKNGDPPMVYASTRSTLLGRSHQSHVLSNSHGLNAYSNADDEGWIQPPVEVPQDPRSVSKGPSELSGRMRKLSLSSDATHQTYQSRVTTKTTDTAWDHFERTNAPYREQASSNGGRVSSAGSNISPGMNSGFAKQGAAKQDQMTKARIQLERERRRKQEQEDQEAVKDSDDDDDDDSDSDPEAKYGY